MNYDNPAARLLAILEHGKRADGQTSCKGVWQQLVGPDDDDQLLMARIGKVMALPRSAVEAIEEAFPGDGDMWRHWAAQVNAAFMVQNLHGNWESFIGNIDAHSMTYLRMTATLLAGVSNTKLIATDRLSEIKAEFQSILDELLKSEQPQEVKKYLTRALRNIIMTIEEYRLTGALPLLDAIDMSTGHMIRDKSLFSSLTDTDIGKRLIDNLNAMSAVVTVAVGVPQLTQTIQQLLT